MNEREYKFHEWSTKRCHEIKPVDEVEYTGIPDTIGLKKNGQVEFSRQWRSAFFEDRTRRHLGWREIAEEGEEYQGHYTAQRPNSNVFFGYTKDRIIFD